MIIEKFSAIPKIFGNRRFRVLLALLLLFCTVAGARLMLVERYAGPGPFWDQWSGEAGALYKPWVEGTISWEDWVRAHNEHRILLPRLQALAIFAANQGQWEPLAQIAANTFLAGLSAVLFALIVYHGCGPALFKPGILICLLLFAAPLAWQNMFYGFQSQFFLQIFFTLLALWGAGLRRPFSPTWWLGITALVLVVFTSGSGFSAALSLAFVLGIRWWRSGRSVLGAGFWSTLGACALTALAGWLLKVEVPWHDRLKATSFGDMAVALWKNLAWPLEGFWWAACLLPLPAALLFLLHLRDGWRFRKEGRKPDRSNADGLLLVGSWCFLQLLAMSYARGVDGLGPQPRYLDIHVLFLAVNAAAMVLLVCGRRTGAPGEGGRGPAPWVLRLGTLWGVILIVAVTAELSDTVRWRLPALAKQGEAQVANVRGYLATGDRETYLYGKARLDIPYPDPDLLADMLDDPVIRSFLPAVLQSPVVIEPDPGEGEGDAFRHQAGLTPSMSTPPAEYDSFWGSYAPGSGVEGVFRSYPFQVSKGGLRFQVGGYFGESSMHLRIVDADSGRTVEVSGVPDQDRSAWRYASAPVPGGTVYLEAVDGRPRGWFAFTAPVEVGRLTLWLSRLEEAARWLFLLGAVPLLYVGLGDLLRGLRNAKKDSSRAGSSTKKSVQSPTPPQ